VSLKEMSEVKAMAHGQVLYLWLVDIQRREDISAKGEMTNIGFLTSLPTAHF